MTQPTAILPTAYFGNIEYFSILLKYDKILIEAYEHFIKQTLRNHCVIATANGPLKLTVPVNFSNSQKTKIKDVTIDYSKNWQKQHFKAIESAYRKAPFYEFYIDDFIFVFEKKEKYLLDLNMKILSNTLEILNISKAISSTFEYLIKYEDILDFRYNFQLSKQNTFKQYNQIFIDRLGFLRNLSLLDLLFCIGEESKFYIREIIR